MITSIFSVYDSKTAAYLPPFYMPTKPAAIRAISDAVNNPDHVFFKHAADYHLYYLGEFNDQNCGFKIEEAPMNLCGLHEIQSQENHNGS